MYYTEFFVIFKLKQKVFKLYILEVGRSSQLLDEVRKIHHECLYPKQLESYKMNVLEIAVVEVEEVPFLPHSHLARIQKNIKPLESQP